VVVTEVIGTPRASAATIMSNVRCPSPMSFRAEMTWTVPSLFTIT